MPKITGEQMVEWLKKKIEWATNYLNDLNLRESESAESSLLREDIEMLGAILSALEGPGEERKDFPTIICLCGSTKFKSAFERANFTESLAGKIVLSVGAFAHADGGEARELIYGKAGLKSMLDIVHFRKIELADEVMILNVGGYIGESTRNELEYAKKLGKKIIYFEPLGKGAEND